MSPGDIDQILTAISRLKSDLQEVSRDVREVKADGKETKAQATKTNSRVTRIEQDRAVEKALHEQHEQARHEDLMGFRDKMARQAGMRTALAGAVVATVGLLLVYLLLQAIGAPA